MNIKRVSSVRLSYLRMRWERWKKKPCRQKELGFAWCFILLDFVCFCLFQIIVGGKWCRILRFKLQIHGNVLSPCWINSPFAELFWEATDEFWRKVSLEPQPRHLEDLEAHSHCITLTPGGQSLQLQSRAAGLEGCPSRTGVGIVVSCLTFPHDSTASLEALVQPCAL